MEHFYFNTNFKTTIKTRRIKLILSLFIFLVGLLSASTLNAQINVNSTGGQTSTTTYSTLKLAFDSINVGKHTGSIIITVTANTTETATAVLNASGSGSASYSSILIKPTGGGLKTIGTSLAAPLIDLNGADNVTFDGLYPGNDSLLLVNSSTAATAGTCTVRFINGACKNRIQNCGVFGGSASTTSGTIFFSTDAGSTNGNDSNLISGVLMGDAASSATPRYQIYGQGTTGKENNFNTIQGCWIYNFFSGTTGDRAGIYLGTACSDFTIYNNSFFQDVSRSISTATFSGIYISNTSGNFIVRKNKIGGTAPDCGGTALTLTTAPQLQAIYLNVGTTTKTIVDSNVIANISMSTTNTSIVQSLIHINNGKVDIKNNTLGSQSVAASISIPSNPTSTTFSAIGMGSGSFDTINISNNTIGGISVTGSGGMSLRGVDITGSTATMLINNNTFGSTTVSNSWYQSTSNSIIAIIMRGNYAGVTHQIMNNTFANFGSASSQIYCIYTGGSTCSFNVTGNLIYNMSTARNTAGTGVSAAIIGIIVNGGGVNQTIAKNIIYALKVTGTGAGAMTVSGITTNATATGNTIVTNNLIHSLNVDVAGGIVNGIDIVGGNYTYFNNMIRLGIDENGSGILTATNFNGINESGGINSFYYNSVYIGGINLLPVASSSNAFISSLSSVSRQIKNNIFANLRTGGLSSSKNYSIKLGGVTSQSINNNDYYTGTSFIAQNNGTDYASLTSWQAATNQDSISVSANPVYKNPTGSTTNLNLHIDTAGTAVSFLESSGANIGGITNDYDNDTRPGPNGSVKGGGTKPDIGADEFDGVPRVNCSNTVAGVTTGPVDTICISGITVLSLTGSTGLGIGNVYQWQSSTDGINFSNITNANQTQYTTATLTTTTYFRCVVTCSFGSTSSNATAKKITVLNPQIASTTPAQRCGNGTVVLSAVAASGTIRWYANATGGSVLDTGITFTTPTLSATTTYYVEAYIGSCTSTSRTPVVATISVVPIITGTTPGSICGPGSVPLSASCSAGTISWFTNSTGGVSLATGASFNTPSITTTTTYYVEATYATCTSATRTPITATIIPLPTITSSTPGTVCGSGSAVLHATSSAGYINWYSSATGGAVLDTGTTFTTPVIFSGITYYAEAKNGSCASSPRTPVLASVSSIPTINGTNSASGCKFDKITLGATASAGTINWYTTASGGTSIATGPSYITPSLISTTVYYVDATNNGCTTSFRTPVTATINITPSITNVTNASACGSGSVNLIATASSGLVNWYTDSIAGNLLNTGNTFSTPNLTSTTVYFVDATANGCTSSPRTRVVATIKKIPVITGVIPNYSCRPGSVVLGANTGSGTVRWYNVSFGGAVLATGPSYSTPLISATTTYYVDVIDSGCISASRIAVDATIYPALDKTTTVAGNTITASANGVSYVWVDCNNGFIPIPGETNKSFTANKNGSYAVIVKSNFCSDTSVCTVFNKIGITGTVREFTLTLIPNPAGNFVVLKSDISYIGKSFRILDLAGSVIFTGTINSEEQPINLENISSGNYIFSVDGLQRKSLRLLKN